MTRSDFLAGLLVMLLAAPGPADQFADVRAKINAALQDGQVPSLAVAVAKEGHIIWEEAFGWADRENRVAATPHTIYSLASISKPITATGLMVLVERGQVDLDQPANSYLGQAKLTARLGSAYDATIRRLANHTSGLPLHYQFFYADESIAVPPFDESLRRYGVLMRPPGERYEYANFGYGVLDQIIARESGTSYADFMRREVFLPLGMTHTSVGIAKGLEAHAAVRYGSDQAPLPLYDFDHPGASAVFASVHDLIRFGMFHLQQLGPDQKEILTQASIDAMQQPTAEIGDQRHYGVGWFIDQDEYGYRTVSHTGGMSGVRTRLCLVPSEHLAVAVLCNTSTNVPLQMTREILAALLPTYAEQFRKAPEHRPNGAGKGYAPPELVGYWSGVVDTYQGERRLEMWVKPDGDIHVGLEEQLLTVLNSSRLHNGRLTGVFSGDIGTDDANRRPYQLHLDANLRGAEINGSLTAISLPAAKGGNALSYWVGLQRVDQSPETTSLFNGRNLDGWRVLEDFDFQRHGPVVVRDKAIILEAGTPATGISCANAFPRADYEVSLEAKRLEGSDFFCGMTFPVNDNYLTLIIGGWGGGVTGLSNLDDLSAAENETTSYTEFESDRWYQIRLRVTQEKVEAWIDDRQIVDVMTPGRKLSIWWEQEPVRPFGIASWHTTAALRNLILKRL